MLRIEIDADSLRPVIEQVAAEALRQFEEQRAKFGSRLAFTEPEAAALLGVQPHVLRDLRLLGEVKASKVGRRIAYTRDALLSFLEHNRWTPK